MTLCHIKRVLSSDLCKKILRNAKDVRMVNAKTGGTLEWTEILYKNIKQNTIFCGWNTDSLIVKS